MIEQVDAGRLHGRERAGRVIRGITISRWENGQREVDWPEFMVMGFLVDDKLAGRTTVLARAKALAEPQTNRYVRLRFQPP